MLLFSEAVIVNCKDCSSQSCRTSKATPSIKWRLDYGKVFRLLAFITLILAWFWGQQHNRPDWKSDIQGLYPNAKISAMNGSEVLFSMVNKDVEYYVSVATDNSYGGPLTLASVITKEGKIKTVELLNHSDTPAYIQKLLNAGYLRQFQRKSVDYLPIAGKNWDSVSGATLSSNAIMHANTRASHTIARLSFSLSPKPLQKKIDLTLNHVLIALLIALSVINIWIGSKKLKLTYVLGSIIVIGFMTNQLLNVANFSGLLLGFAPALSENLGFWILFGSVFVAVILLGRNIYCGHICPFHAIQYLLQKIGNLNFPLLPIVLKYGRYIPKIGLWVALMIGLVTTNPSAGAYEPFSMIFSLQGDGIQWFIMPAVIVGCFFIPDMFCRFFCPAGEMLTLLVNFRNNLAYQIKQLVKRKKTRR